MHCCHISRLCSHHLLLVVVLTLCGATVPLLASSEDDLGAESISAHSAFREALIRERSIRAGSSSPAPLADYRANVAAYTRIANHYPTEPYASRALWQAATLCLIAFEHAHDKLDRDTGLALLKQLRQNHPNSYSTKRISEQVDRFNHLLNRGWLTYVRHSVLGPISRVILQFDSEVRFQTSRLNDPAGVLFDFDNTEVAPVILQNASAIPEGHISGIRFGQHSKSGTRVVLDIVESSACNVLTLYEPFRVVTDCRSDQRRPAKSSLDSRLTADPSPAFPNLVGKPDVGQGSAVRTVPQEHVSDRTTRGRINQPTLFRQLGLGVSRVVIDPGHGGRDPGAVTDTLQESVLVLDIAHRVVNRLEQYGIETVMTRRADRYLPLEARTNFANRVRADLFLSIHANADVRSEIRGIETYVLDFAPTAEAATTATRENRYANGTLDDLDTIIRTIGASAKATESTVFANFVQQRLVKKLRNIDPEIPDLGVKKAPFVVLIGTGVPSALVEISFISNKRDARLLETDSYRDMIADGLVEAVVGYSETLRPFNRPGGNLNTLNGQ